MGHVTRQSPLAPPALRRRRAATVSGSPMPVVCALGLALAACGSDDPAQDPGAGAAAASGGTSATGAAGGGAAGASSGGAAQGGSGTGWPAGNEYSWNGSWSPAPEDFPLAGLFDDEYFDGHLGAGSEPTPILPPGAWDWSDPDDDLANWRNFRDNLGDFVPLRDGAARQFGWSFVGNQENVDFSGPAAYFEGSSGVDSLELGSGGAIHSYGEGDLADGPDLLVFDQSWSIHFRTGSTAAGAARDDDLVIAGCGENLDGSFDIETTTIHTGPGSDWVFVRDLDRAAVDLGNGDGGITSVVDPLDGDDLVVLRGNTHDFRVIAGNGDDVAVWYVDDNVQSTAWLGPNFFGAGAWGDGVWDDTGTDRLVLAVPPALELVTAPPTPLGGLLVMPTSGELVDDPPTADDPYAHYCAECAASPTGRKTVVIEYRSADDSVRTGYFGLTAFEELQLGVGAGARVFALDDVTGTLTERTDLAPFEPPSPPDSFCH